MAKRRKTTKKTTRRRRVSGIGAIGNTITNIALLGVGAAVSEIAVNKFLSSQNDTLKGAVQLAAGAVIPMVIKKPMATTAGYGMIAAGALKLIKSTGVISGIDDAFEVQLAGYEPLQTVGAYEPLQTVGEYGDFDSMSNENLM